MYAKRDSNPHATVTSPMILSHGCLPVPTLAHTHFDNQNTFSN